MSPNMAKKTRRTFSPEFRVDSANVAVEQHYSVREAASAVGVGHFTMDKWARQLRKEHLGVTPKHSAMTPEHQRINEREKRLCRVEEHSTTLTKAVLVNPNRTL